MLKEIRKNYKRLVAFLLSITMIIMNMGGNAITAFAGEEREISLFMAEGEKILEAAAHLQDQEEFTKEDWEEMGLDAPKNSIIKKYEKLFLPEEGKIYELDVDIDDHLAAEGTELRIFYHSKEKEVIFLFLNESNQDIDFCVNIDGYETKLVTVASNTAAVEAGEEETPEEPEGKENGDEKEPGEDSGKKDNSTVSGGNSGGTSGSVSGGASGGGTKETSGNVSGETSDDTSDKTPESTSKDNLENAPEGTGESESKVNDDKTEEKDTVDKADSAEVNDEKEAGGDEAVKEEPAETDSEKKDEAVKEEAAETNSEKKDEAVKEESAEKNSEKKDEAVKEDSAEKNSEKKDEAVKEDSEKEQPEKKDEAAKEEPAEKQSEKKEESVKEDTAKSEDRGSSEDKSSEDKSSKGESAEKSDSSSQEKDSHDKGSSSDEGKNLSLSNHKTAMVFVSLDALEDLEAEGEAKETEPETAAEAVEDVKEETQEEETAAEVSKEETKADITAEQEPAEEEKESQKTSEPETAAEVTTAAVEESVKETAVQEESAGTAEETVAEGEAQTEEEGAADAVMPEIPQESVLETLETEEITGAAMQEEISAKADEETTLQESTQETSAEQEEKADGAASADEEENEVSREDDGNYDDWEILGKTYDAVTIRQTITARVYCVDLEDVKKAVELSQGTEEEQAEFHVDYLVNIDEAAKITGDAYVAEGEDLYFAVEPKEGFEIASVHVNGNMAEAVEDPESLEDSSSWKGYAYVYRVEDVVEDLCIEVEMAEMETIIAAAVYTAETSDAIVRVDVPEGAFAEEVDLKVEKIEDKTQLAELTAQANRLLEEGKIVAEFLAYDVSFISKESGKEVEPMYTVSVNIQVKKSMISDEVSEDAIGVSVLHLPEDGEAKIMTSTEKADETEFAFQATEFSPYGIAVLAVQTGDVAQIGELKYQSLQEAINASEAEQEILLLTDTSENIVSKNKSYTLNMQGHTLSSGAVGKNVFEIDGGTVTLMHGTITGGDWGSNTTQDGKAIKATNDAVLTLENCVVKNNRGHAKSNDKGGIINMIGGKLTLKDSSITDNTASGGFGGGIYAKNCTVSVLGNSSISENSGNNYGGSMYIDGGSLTIDGGKDRVQINNNSNTSYMRGSIYVKNAPVTIAKADLADVECAIEIENTTQEVSISNVKVTGEKTKMALRMKATGTVEVSDSEFASMTSSNSSAAVIQLEGIGSVKTLKNCQFLDNKGEGQGWSPVYIKSGSAIIEGSTFKGNKGFKAGAVYKAGTGVVSVKNSFMTENEGIGTNGSGAIYATGNSETTIENCRITGNIGTYAGAIYHGQGTMNVVDTVIKENKATNSTAGGGVYVSGGTFQMPVRTAEDKNAAIYANNSEKSNANDVYIASFNANVAIMPAASMKDDNVDFEKFGYIWTNMASSEIKTELTTNSNSTRTWTAMPTNRNVAKIGDVEYPTLADAMKAVKNNETITLIAGEDGSGNKSLPSGGMYVLGTGTGKSYTYVNAKNITIDMNGCSIYPTDTASKYQTNLNYGVFQVKNSGYVLNLKGPGVIGNRVLVSAGAVLNIDGDVAVKSLAYSGDSVNGIHSNGTVNVRGSVDTLTAKINEGEFNLAKDCVVNSITLASASGKVITLNINGIIRTMTLKQSGNTSASICSTANINANVGYLELVQTGRSAVTNLDGEIGTLYLKTFQSGQTAPVTKAGSNFKVDILTLRPYLGSGHPSLSDMANPNQDVSDIVMITGMDGHILTEEQVNWAKASWENANSTGTNEKGNNTLTWSGDNKDYKFLTSPVLDEEKNQIVLRKTLVDGNYVFLGSNNSSIKAVDTNDGLKSGNPVATFAKAKEVLQNNSELNTIYVLGPITVSKGETWELEAGKQIQRYKSYGGVMVKVQKGAVLTLQNIVIDGGSQSNMKVKASAAMIEVDSGAVLNVKEGALLQNNANKDTIVNLFNEGGAIRNAGTLNMEGGMITGNTSACGGGIFNRGVFNFSGGSIAKNQGSGESKNSNGGPKDITVPDAGGGVFIGLGGTMNMSGGSINENKASMGGGISIGNGNSYYTSNNNSILNMSGGTIVGNEATNESRYDMAYAGGGGIYVQMGGVANIEAGNIIGNKSYGGHEGGGGIYVNGRVGAGVPKNLNFGQLNLKNVLITENTAKSDGGGIAVCDVGSVKVYLTDGGIIHNNEGSDQKYDIFLSDHISSSGHGYGYGIIDISRYMLGGGQYKWMDMKTGKLATYSTLHSHNSIKIYSAASEITGENQIKVRITDNYSATKGGGIGSNGNVSIGTGNTDLMDIKVKKEWKKPNGEVLSGEELKDISNNIFYISYELWMKHDAEGGSVKDEEPSEANGWECIDTRRETIQTNAPYWNGVTFPNLAKRDEDGAFIYKVKEVPDDRFISEVKENEDGTWTVTNTPAYSLKLSKEVVDNYGVVEEGKEFTFIITLKEDSGAVVNKTFEAVRTVSSTSEDGTENKAETEEQVIFTGGQTTVKLKDGESIHIKGLSSNMKYMIVEQLSEEDSEDYNVSFDITWADKDREKGEHGSGVIVGSESEGKTIHYGATNVKFTNTVKKPIGKLEISKTVQVDGKGEKETEKDWHFILQLWDNINNPLNVSGAYIPYTKKMADGKTEQGIIKVHNTAIVEFVNGSVQGSIQDPSDYSIALRDGESLLIENLPAGTKYKVIEKEANTDSYITTVASGAVVTEDNGLVSAGAGVIVKNETVEAAFTNTIHTVGIKGEKIWNDQNNQDGKRPENITIKLLADGEELEDKEIKVTAENGWKWTFEDLPKYKNGKEIKYTFSESGAAEFGYNMTELVQPNQSNNYQGRIVNSYTPDEVYRMVIKKWDDHENQDGFRPESITVQLFADGSPVGDPLVLDEANGWQGEWKNLPKNKGGKEILYEVKEISELSQYTSSVTYEETTRLFTITNRHTPEEKALKVVKAWDDHENQDGLRPESITVQLLADGLPLGDSLTLSEANNWEGEWKNLPKYKNGKEILYEVKETSEVSQYSSSVVYDEVTGVFTITNRHTPEERTLKVVKEWDDQDNQAGFRPSSIEVQLMADGVLQGAAVTLNEGNQWSHEWRNLPRYKNGKEITYEVQETSALGRYTASISYNEETEVFTVTNRYVPEVRTLKARKVWEDHNNQDNLRPASVEVQLMADDEPAGNPVTLNEENQWSCEWKDLPSYKNGKMIAYRVVENTVVENYSVTYSYDEETSIFTITNTHTPEGEKPNEPSEPSNPENPTNPGNPGNSNPPSGGGRTRRDRTPSTPQPPTTIPQEEVPLTNFEPEEVPLASLPSDNQVVFVPIEDEGIPLFGLPRTGDRGVSTGALLGMMISSFMVACGIHAKRRKEKEE